MSIASKFRQISEALAGAVASTRGPREPVTHTFDLTPWPDTPRLGLRIVAQPLTSSVTCSKDELMQRVDRALRVDGVAPPVAPSESERNEFISSVAAILARDVALWASEIHVVRAQTRGDVNPPSDDALCRDTAFRERIRTEVPKLQQTLFRLGLNCLGNAALATRYDQFQRALLSASQHSNYVTARVPAVAEHSGFDPVQRFANLTRLAIAMDDIPKWLMQHELGELSDESLMQRLIEYEASFELTALKISEREA